MTSLHWPSELYAVCSYQLRSGPWFNITIRASEKIFGFSAKFEAQKVFSFIHLKISASVRRARRAWFSDALIKMSSYLYRKSHCGDKTVVRSSYLHNGISYTGKMSSLYWIMALNKWLKFCGYYFIRCFFLKGNLTSLYLNQWQPVYWRRYLTS